MKILTRCDWVTDDPLYQAYHDNEWGIGTQGTQDCFELLCLEGMQAGLSWLTILKRRAALREKLNQFDPIYLAGCTDQQVDAWCHDPDMIRHRGKCQALIKNAQALITFEEKGHNFSQWLWSFVEGQAIVHHYEHHHEVPTQDHRSTRMARELKQLGFSFVGPTICYAFMQAAGLYVDHQIHCHCHPNQCI